MNLLEKAKEIVRLRYAYNWKLFFWTWHTPFFYSSIFYDGWNNQFNLGIFCISWMTPPLKENDC